MAQDKIDNISEKFVQEISDEINSAAETYIKEMFEVGLDFGDFSLSEEENKSLERKINQTVDKVLDSKKAENIKIDVNLDKIKNQISNKMSTKIKLQYGDLVEKYNKSIQSSDVLTTGLPTKNDVIKEINNVVNQEDNSNYLAERFKKYNKDVDTLINGFNSAKELKKSLIKKYNAQGIGLRFEGNKAYIWDLKKHANDWSKASKANEITSIELASLESNGDYVRRGGTSVVNVAHLGKQFYGNGKSGNVLTSAYEQQFKNMSNILGKDGSGKIVQAVKGGDLETAKSIVNMAIGEALSGLPSGTSASVDTEVAKDIYGKKNRAQMSAIGGLFRIDDLIKNLYSYKQESIKKIYDELKIKDSANPYDLSSNELIAATTAYALSAMGLDTSEGAKLSDSLLKRFLVDPEFEFYRTDAKQFAKAGFMPSFESLKEESFMKGFMTISGAHDVLPFNVFGDNSNRALYQIFNYNKRASSASAGAINPWATVIGNNLGIDYNSPEFSQYIGATTTDEKVYEAFKALEYPMEMIKSVYEGGMIVPQSFADKLASYRELNYTGYEDTINEEFLQQFGLTLEDLKNSNESFIDLHDRKMTGADVLKFTDAESLGINDVVNGIKILKDGFQLITEQYVQAAEGTKGLVEGGGRQTLRILPDEMFNALTDKLGYSKGVRPDFLTEEKSLSSKNIMPELRGRLSYFINQALNEGKSLEEIVGVLNKSTLGKTIKILDGKLTSTAFYDDKDKKYKYVDEANNVQNLFVNEFGQELEDEIKKAFIEGTKDSDFSKIGTELLGVEKYTQSLGKSMQMVNVASEYPYFEGIGTANPNRLESKGRVKFADRERRAEERTFASIRNAIDEGFKEGIELFIEDETKQINSYGEKGLKAQAIRSKINESLDNQKGYSGSSSTSKGLKGALDIEFLDDNSLKIGEKNFKTGEYLLKLDRQENGGIKEEDYKKSIMYLAREEMKNGGYSDIAFKTGMRKLLLADQEGVQLHNGNYELSATEIANSSLFNNILRDKISETSEDAMTLINEDIEQFFKDYDKIANNKDSQLFKDATESYIGNAGYSKAVGYNKAYTADNPEDINTIYQTSQAIREKLRSENTIDSKRKNIQNLSWMLKASGMEYFADGLPVEKLSNLAQSSEKMQDLLRAESMLVNNIVERVKNGEMTLYGQFHRYPSTNGRDIRYTKIGINDNLSDEAIQLSRGLSLTGNADYDGDKVWSRILFANSDFKNFDDFEKSYQAAAEIEKRDAQVARGMEEWEHQKSGNSDIDSDINKLIAEYENRDVNFLSSLMSKANKKYVGTFSNMSTNTRNFMQDMGLDEVENVGTETSAKMALVRAYLESIEQDSISAKKVFARLITEGKSEDTAVEELNDLYKLLVDGDFEDAIAKSEAMGMDFSSSRQLEFMKQNLKAYDPELYEKMVNDLSSSDGILALLKEGFKIITDTANANKLSNWDVVHKTKARRQAIGSHQAQRAKEGARVYASSEANVIETDIKADKKSTYEAFNEAKKAVDSFVSDTITNGANYDNDHVRYDSRGQKADSVTDLLGFFRNYGRVIPMQQQYNMQVAASKGTYAHKIAELLGKNDVTKIEDLDDKSLLELEKAEIELSNALNGDVTDDLIEKLRARAQSLATIAKQEGLMGENVLQEQTLGGKFEERYASIGGQADIISYQQEGGLTVGDYKFSNTLNKSTDVERLIQASVYLALYEEQLESELKKLQLAQEKGELDGTGVQRIEQISEQLASAQTPNGRNIKIIQSFEKNGQLFNKVLTAKAIEKEEALRILNDLQGFRELATHIGNLEKQLNSGSPNVDMDKTRADFEVAQAKMNQLMSKAIIDQPELLNYFNGSTYTNMNGDTVSEEHALSGGKGSEALISKYLKGYKEILALDAEIANREQVTSDLTGEELKNTLKLLDALREKRKLKQGELDKVNIDSLPDDYRKFFDEQIKALELENVIKTTKDNLKGSRSSGSGANILYNGRANGITGQLAQRFTNFLEFGAAQQVINKLRQSLQQLINVTKQLDTEIVNIRIATGYSANQVRDLMLEYSNLADEIGRTTQSVAQAANDWLRAGYEGAEASELVKASMYLSTLGMMDASKATEALISVLKGWKLSSDEVIGVVDKLVLVDMQAATSAGDIATAMSKVNNSAQMADVSMNTLIGILTTGMEVSQQAPESVGNAWRTVISRMQNVKAGKFAASASELSSDNYDEQNYTALNDVETVLNAAGITIRESANTWRSTESILNEIAAKWGTFDDITKSAIANAAAGTRQREQFITIMGNWESVQEYSNLAAEAYGTATQKMEAYTNSIEAAKNRLTAAFETLALNFNQNGTIAEFYNLMADIVGNLKGISIVTAVGLVTTTMLNLNGQSAGFSNSIVNLGIKLAELGTSAKTASTGLKEIAASRLAINQRNGKNLGIASEDFNWANVLSGAASIVAPLAGSTLGYNLSKDNQALGGAIGGVISSGVVQLAAKINPWAAVAITGIESLVSLFTAFKSSYEKKQIEQAQTAFTEAEQSYTEARSSKTYAQRIEELAYGVDSFGRNIALTEEEYKDFIEANNKLATIFPEMIGHYDGEGNAIIELGNAFDDTANKAVTLADTIGEKIEYLQAEADKALLDPNVGGKNFKETADQINDVEKEIKSNNKSIKTLEKNISIASMSPNELMEYGLSLMNSDNSDNQAAGEYLYNYGNLQTMIAEETNEEYKQFLNNSLEDYANRLYSYGYSYLSANNSGDYIDQAKKSIDNLSFENQRLEQKIAELNATMKDEINAILRQHNEYYTGLDPEMQAIVQRGMSDINLGDFDASQQGYDAWKEAIGKREDFLIKQLNDNPEFVNHLNMRYSGNTLGERHTGSFRAINDLYQIYLQDPAAAKTLAESYGYIFNENEKTFEDPTDLFLRLKGIDSSRSTDYQNLTYDQGSSLLEYLVMGLSTDSAFGLMNTDSIDMSQLSGIQWQGAKLSLYDPSQFQSFVGESEKTWDKIEDPVEKSKEIERAITEEYSDMPKTMREAMIQTAKEYEEGEINLTDIAQEMGEERNRQMESTYRQEAAILAKEAFPDIDTGADGIIGEWDELKKAVDSIVSSYKAYDSAMKEQNATGKLSAQTVLDLINTNAAYVDALDVKNGEILLSGEAERIAHEIEIEAVKEGIRAKIAELQTENESLQNKLDNYEIGSQIAQEEADDAADAADAEIAAQNAAGKAIANTANIALDAARAFSIMHKAMKDENGEFDVNRAIAGLTKSTKIAAEEAAFVERTMITVDSQMREGWQKQIDRNNKSIEILEALHGYYEELEENDYGSSSLKGLIATPDTSGSGKAKTALEKYKDLLGAINKEYQQMRALQDSTTKGFSTTFSFMNKNYYEAKRNILDKALAEAKKENGGRSLTDIAKLSGESFDKALAAFKEVQELYVEIENLDDEEVQDKIDILSALGMQNISLVEQHKLLLSASDTDIERLENANKLHEALEKQIQSMESLLNYQEQLNEYVREYGDEVSIAASPLSQKYIDSYKEEMEILESRLGIYEELSDLNKEKAESDVIKAFKYNNQGTTEEDIKAYKESAEYQKELYSNESYQQYLDNEEKMLDIKREMKDLDEERIQNTIDYLELLSGTNEDLVEQYKLMISEADSEAEKLEFIQKYNEAIREQNALIHEQLGFFQDLTQTQLQYEDSNPWSKNYNKFIKRSKEFYTEQKNNALANAKEYYQQAKDMWITAGYSEEIAEAKAYYDEDYQQALQDYIEAYQNAADVTMRVFNDKIDAIERKIDQLNVTKPREWITTWKGPKPFETGLEKINEYYTAMEGFYKDELEVAKATLEQIADLTDEQIDELVDKYNNTLKAILDNQISQAEDTKSYQESVYNALVNQVGRYKKELEDAKKIVEEQYDTEIKKLQDKNAGIERTNKLLQLQKNLQNAQKEKRRVFRQGVGWTYETDRNAIKSAQSELDAFYRQDTIEDLQATKNAELEVLNARIQDWDNYLAMLQQRYQSYQVLMEQRLLMETLEVETETALRAAIVEDMTNFNLMYDGLMNILAESITLNSAEIIALLSDGKLTLEELINATGLSVEELTNLGGEKFSMAIQTNGQLAVDALSNFCNNYDTVFGTFLDDYTTNLEQLEELKKKELELLNAQDYNKYNGNDLVQTLEKEITGGTKGSKNSKSSKEKEEDNHKGQIFVAGVGYVNSDNGLKTGSLPVGSVIHNDDGTKTQITGINSDGSYRTADYYGEYAEGIKKGPVTYTGLAMLHGSPSNPEYVLTNDQAYNLLNYMATNKPEISSRSVDNGTIYNFTGGITMNGVNDPEEFFAELMKATSNRFNVTKNK